MMGLLNFLYNQTNIRQIPRLLGRDLSKYLEDNENYSLILESHQPFWLHGVFRDTKKSLALYREGKKEADAVVGFGYLSRDEMIIRQIQANPDVKKEDLPKRWERKLVKSITSWARDKGIKRLYIQKAESNLYYKHDTQSPRNLRLKIRYDVTAQRMGFTLDEIVGAWAINL